MQPTSCYSLLKAFVKPTNCSISFLLVAVRKERITKLRMSSPGTSSSFYLPLTILVIPGVFDQFIRSPMCKHVVFGACHDNGYVRKLEGFVRDPSVCGRLTLLKSFETGREFSSLPFRET